MGGAFAGEALPAPFATVSILPFGMPSRHRPPVGFGLAPGHGLLGHARDAALRRAATLLSARLDRALARAREQAGLPPIEQHWFDCGFSPSAVLATGSPSLDFGGAVTCLTRPVARNVYVHDWLPFDDVLAVASCMVTNGGWGGTLAALSQGIPLVLAGSELDKPEVAARVAWTGAGIDLRTGRPTGTRVGSAIVRVLSEPGYRTAAWGWPRS